MKSILLTGCNGLLGHELLLQLANNTEFNIFGISRNELDVVADNITPIIGDLSNPNFILELPKQIDYIIHLAQSNEFRYFPEKAMDIFNINVQSTQLLLDYGVKASCKKFIFTSTGGVYTGNELAYKESFEISCVNELGYYATSKLIAEQIIRSYQHQFQHIIFRPFFIYGKRQKKDMLIPRLIENVKKGIALTIDGEEGLKINPIHVSDAAQAIVHSISNKVETQGLYNLGGNEILSIRKIGEIISSCLNLDFQLNQNLEKKPINVCGDITKLTADIYSPKVSFIEGVKEMLHEK